MSLLFLYSEALIFCKNLSYLKQKEKQWCLERKTQLMTKEIIVYLYTDGACSGNPGPGGWGAILKAEGVPEKELSGGENHTTNNRMELMGAIAGLEAIKRPCKVILTSDSQYLVNSITKGWVYNWQEKNWIKNEKPVPNTELWKRLLVQLERHDVEFRWVRGHAGHPENERCDKMATDYIRKHGR